MKKTVFATLTELRNQAPYFGQALSLVWKSARPWTISWAILLIIQGLLPVATVYLTRTLVDSLVEALDAGGSWAALQPVLVWVGLMALVLLLTQVLGSLSSWIRTGQGELVSDHIYELIHEKAITLDIAYFETPAFYDQLHRARVDAISRPVALLDNVGNLTKNTITLVAMAAVLLSFGPWIPALLIVSTLPALLIVVRFTLRLNQWRLKNTSATRRTRYYDRMLTLDISAAEVRLFDLGKHFKDSFQTLRARLRTEKLQLSKEQAFAELGAGVIALLAMGAAIAWMVWQTVQGANSLGDLALFYQAFNQGQRLMRALLSNAGEIYRNLFFLDNLFEFLALDPQVVNPPTDASETRVPKGDIKLQNITFQYPESHLIALQNFNLTIPEGQIVAIVGENGAGKSTLIKLLCRFYDPQAGTITFGDADLRDFHLSDLRRQITVMFQQPVKYHETAYNNIAYGNLTAQPDFEQVQTAAQAAGANIPIEKLSKGYETVLGKWFGGAELSGGEWQRIALARAFLRQAQLIILDEPTSAMDSWAEADWLSRFRTLVAGRTSLIVTHRFTTAMQADIIHVMDAGNIIESGNHAELMAMNGRYASSWREQTRVNLYGSTEESFRQ